MGLLNIIKVQNQNNGRAPANDGVVSGLGGMYTDSLKS